MERGFPKPEDRELAGNGRVLLLEGGRREHQQAFYARPIPRPLWRGTLGMAERKSHDPITNAALRTKAVLEVVSLIDNDQVRLGNRRIERAAEGVAETLGGLRRNRVRAQPGNEPTQFLAQAPAVLDLFESQTEACHSQEEIPILVEDRLVGKVEERATEYRLPDRSALK